MWSRINHHELRYRGHYYLFIPLDVLPAVGIYVGAVGELEPHDVDDGSVPPPESLGSTGAPWGAAETVLGNLHGRARERKALLDDDGEQGRVPLVGSAAVIRRLWPQP
jgi:hypothetical protein